MPELPAPVSQPTAPAPQAAAPVSQPTVPAPQAAAPASPSGAVLHSPLRRRLPNRRLALVLFVVMLSLLAAVVCAGIALAPTATATDFSQKNLSPGLGHLFGTDWMGRDMFARTTAGLATSVLVGLLAAGASACIALVLGMVAALGGKKADGVVLWLVDLVMGIPHILLILLISFALGKGFWGVAVGVALTHWTSLARVVRAEVIQCRQAPYVALARRLGRGPLDVAARHMLPAVLPQFLVGLILLFPHAILHEAAITFLGFGLPPELPAIGSILSEAVTYLSSGMWWLALLPGVALLAAVLLFDRAGACLRSLIDPYRAQE